MFKLMKQISSVAICSTFVAVSVANAETKPEGVKLYTCFDNDSNSGFVFKAATLEGIPKVTLSKQAGFQGKPLETAEYTWSAGLIAVGPGVQPYHSVFSSFKALNVLPKQFELDYLQSEAKEFPAFVVLKIGNGIDYDVFKLTCNP